MAVRRRARSNVARGIDLSFLMWFGGELLAGRVSQTSKNCCATISQVGGTISWVVRCFVWLALGVPGYQRSLPAHESDEYNFPTTTRPNEEQRYSLHV